MPLRLVPVHVGALCVSVAAAQGPLPPLAEVRHVGVVHGHVSVEAQDLPAVPPQAQTKLVVFGSKNARVEAAYLPQRANTHHGDAAACVGLTDRPVPFHVTEQVVDRLAGVPLPAAAADGGDAG